MKGIGSGKVIQSGPNDHVFVNFADHGAPGIIAFPAAMLKATDLMDTINEMYQAKKYAQMVFYIEACESGSMFYELLPTDINVYATTAANHKESSYAIYYDSERRTYLGDVYSVKWMEDSDLEDLKAETLHKQFLLVKQETNTSHVQEFGDPKIGDEPLDDFQGGSSRLDVPPAKKLPTVPFDAVPSGDVEKHILLNTIRDATTSHEREQAVQKLEAHLKLRAEIETIFKHIVGVSTYNHDQAHRILSDRQTLRNFDCYHVTLDVFSEKCFKLPQTEYALRHLYKLVNLCEEGIPPLTIIKALSEVCSAQIY
jgi:legumain